MLLVLRDNVCFLHHSALNISSSHTWLDRKLSAFNKMTEDTCRFNPATNVKYLKQWVNRLMILMWQSISSVQSVHFMHTHFFNSHVWRNLLRTSDQSWLTHWLLVSIVHSNADKLDFFQFISFQTSYRSLCKKMLCTRSVLQSAKLISPHIFLVLVDPFWHG